jgi:hypothetical protein
VSAKKKRIAGLFISQQFTPCALTLEELRALDRGARIAILGIGHLRNQSEHPRHRPKTVDSPLRRDEIAQAVAIGCAVRPEKPKKWIIGGVCKVYKVSRSYVYRVLKEVDPERWEIMEQAAVWFAEQARQEGWLLK